MSAPYYTPQRYSSSTRPGAGKSASASASAAAAAAAGGKGGRIVPASAPGFTATMRDRQARGKDPYAANDSASDSDLDFDDLDTHSPSARGRGRGSSGSGSGGGVGKLGHLRGGGGSGGAGAGGNAGGAAAAAAAAAGAGRRIPPGETYESQRRKEWAIGILEDPEKLAMYACSRGDSIAGTRLYFTRQLCGLDETPTAPQQGLGKASSSSSSSASSRRDPQQRGERVVRC